MSPPPPPDLLDGRSYGVGSQPRWAALRRERPVFFDGASGLWGIASHAAVTAASRRPRLFSSAGGHRPLIGALPMMIDTDDPVHAARRRLVGHGFTARQIAAAEPAVRRICDEIIDAVCERGECDLVGDVAARLPLIVIAEMLGAPESARADLLRWSDTMVHAQAGGAGEELQSAAAAAFAEYAAFAREAVAARRAGPTGDLLSVLVHAEVDGERLRDDELVFDSLLLLVGGDETTRHVISGGMEALLRRPGQLAALREDPGRIALAVEEMLRWVSPIKNMCRTLTEDAEFFGEELRRGQQALLLYESANFDESAFDEPLEFRSDRRPNDHLAFGVGPHFCLGASLARLEARTMVGRLLERLPDLALAGEGPPPRHESSYIAGFAAIPVTFTPSRRAG